MISVEDSKAQVEISRRIATILVSIIAKMIKPRASYLTSLLQNHNQRQSLLLIIKHKSLNKSTAKKA
jgi:hypothetical protein